jgi:hypothetical protein
MKTPDKYFDLLERFSEPLKDCDPLEFLTEGRKLKLARLIYAHLEHLPRDIRFWLGQWFRDSMTKPREPFHCDCSAEIRAKAEETCKAAGLTKRSLEVAIERLLFVWDFQSTGEYRGEPSRASVHRWLVRFNTYGVLGLVPAKSTGRPRKDEVHNV